jgi:glycosyltransferase involved in cell wall biosynthesis
MSKVDVIVPCHGYGRFLTECVTSVLDQSVQDLRVLIIDDASNDETAEIAAELAQKDGRVNWRRHPANRGHIATYNEGLEWASAEYTLILSADDWILPGALSRATQLLDAHPEVGFAYGPHVEVCDGEPRPPQLDAPAVPGWTILTGAEFVRANRDYNPVCYCTAVVRTARQKSIGHYRSELPHAGDMEMWMRFGAHGPVGRVNAYQGVYRRHGRNMSNAYYGDNFLPDLRQRKAAIDMLFDNDGKRMEHADDLRRYLYEGLAKVAVMSAGRPFNQADLNRFDEMLEFAVRIDPEIRRCFAWKWQSMKRLMGPRMWSALGCNRVETVLRRARRSALSLSKWVTS